MNLGVQQCMYNTYSLPVLRIRSNFSYPDPRIRGFLNTDPDPDDPKKAGSDWIRIRILLRYVLVVRKINNFLWHFLTKSNHLMTLKIKNKNYLDETVF